MAKKTNAIDKINIESIKKSLEAGKILPRLKPYLNTVYTVIIDSKDKYFDSDYGKTMTFDVLHDGMKKSLITPMSFKFQLLVEMIRNKLTTIEEVENDTVNYSVLIGKQITFQKTIGSTKEFKEAKLYSVQID